MVGAWLLWVGAARAGFEQLPPGPRACVDLRSVAEGRLALRPPLPDHVPLASAVRPLVVWYDPAHANSAEIAPTVLASLEQAWDVQVDQLGFRPPVLPDAEAGPELDVYLVDYIRFSAFVAADDYGDRVPGDGLNSTSAYMVIDHELPIELVPAWAAHEFNHVLQFATDFSEPTLPIWEGTATAAQAWTFGPAGRWDYDVPTFQEVPHFPALTGDSYTIWPLTKQGSTFEYGAAFWVMYLDQVLVGTTPGAGGVALWEAAANEGAGAEPDVADAVAEVAGMGLGEVLNGFAMARFLTGPLWDERGLPGAQGWGPQYAVPRKVLSGAALPAEGMAPDPAPMITGQVFLDLDLRAGVPAAEGMADPWLVVSVSSASGLVSGLVGMRFGADLELKDVDAVGASPEIAVPLAGTTHLVLALTNLGPPGWDADDEAYTPGDQRVSVRVEERGAGATETGTTSELPPPPEDPADAPAAEQGGCGCGPGGSPAWLALGLAAWSARRARLRRSATGRGSPTPAASPRPARPGARAR